jgi:hypothetical protein
MTIECMQSHPGANISLGEFERITASLLVVRCALPWQGDAPFDSAQDPV